jgi:hypothetical protein
MDIAYSVAAKFMPSHLLKNCPLVSILLISLVLNFIKCFCEIFFRKCSFDSKFKGNIMVTNLSHLTDYFRIANFLKN